MVEVKWERCPPGMVSRSTTALKCGSCGDVIGVNLEGSEGVFLT